MLFDVTLNTRWKRTLNNLRLRTVTFCYYRPLSLQSCTKVCTAQITYVGSICIKGNTQQEGSTDLISELNYLSVLLLATCFGFWKRHYQPLLIWVMKDNLNVTY
jgi:hypothetical protein